MKSGYKWKHLDFSDADDARWIRQESGVPDIVAEALLNTDSRPRALHTDNGVLLILRGVNLNPGSNVEDMVSVRLWIQKNRIISSSRRRLVSLNEMSKQFEAGKGPQTVGEFVNALVERLGDFITEATEKIEESLDAAEDRLNESEAIARNSPFSVARRQTARIRRYLAPQREALDRLSRISGPLFTEDDRARFSEQANHLTLILEDLDLVRERAMVAQEEFLSIVAHEQNARMLVLSIVAAIFLPLSFLTGLMGMNVAGLPGLVNEWAFWILVILMLLTTMFILFLFRLKKWV
jgi:zinc transporter